MWPVSICSWHIGTPSWCFLLVHLLSQRQHAMARRATCHGLQAACLVCRVSALFARMMPVDDFSNFWSMDMRHLKIYFPKLTISQNIVLFGKSCLTHPVINGYGWALPGEPLARTGASLASNDFRGNSIGPSRVHKTHKMTSWRFFNCSSSLL